MSEDLEQLKERTQRTREKRQTKMREKQYEKKPQYQFLPKKQKQMVDFADVEMMFTLLENKMETEFCFVIGILADLQLCGYPLSEDQVKVLKIPYELFQAAVNDK